MDFYDIFTNKLADFIKYMSINLSDDIYERICEMSENEKKESAKAIYASMLDNLSAAKKLSRPICQDTGIIQVFVKVGCGFKYLEKLRESIVEAVRIASEITPLRPNAVLPFIDKNTGDNIAPGSPTIYWELVQGDDLLIEIYCQGGGCSLPGFSKVLFPSEGISGVEKYIVEMAIERGINACPPLYVGVGIGSSADNAANLSKRALLRPVKSQNPDPLAHQLEVDLFNKLTDIQIGPNGLCGTESILGVNVEAECHHPANLAMAVAFSCWVSRHGSIAFDSTGKAVSETHSGWEDKND